MKTKSNKKKSMCIFLGITSKETFDRLQYITTKPLQRIDDACSALNVNVFKVDEVKTLEKYLLEKNSNANFAFKTQDDLPNQYKIFDTSKNMLLDYMAPVNFSCTVLCEARVVNLTWLYVLAPIVVVGILIFVGRALRSKMLKRKIEVSLFHT